MVGSSRAFAENDSGRTLCVIALNSKRGSKLSVTALLCYTGSAYFRPRRLAFGIYIAPKSVTVDLRVSPVATLSSLSNKNPFPNPQATAIGIIFQAFHPPLHSNPTLLVPAKRNPGIDIKVAVHPHAPGFQSSSHPLSAPKVFAPDRRA